jgi:membrane protease YdiL (CAAX protease family)
MSICPAQARYQQYDGISSKAEELFMLALVTPIGETFLFQYLPFYFLKEKWPDVYIILLSALLFGCGHFYNWIYLLNALMAGILYGCVYASKARVGKGFLYTVLFHILYNCFAYIVNHF